MEKPGNNNGEEKKKVKADYIRHSKANYLTYREMVASENPDQVFDHTKQIFPDLSVEGVKLAQESAKEFFKKLDPATEQLFFVSSNEARAIETAGIYRDEALANTFTIIKPEHTRSPISDEHLGGDIRVIDALSINFKNAIASSLLNPPSSRHPVNYDALDPREVTLYKKLQETIDKDNKGTFAANFLAYGDEIKKYLPEFETAEDLYNRNFKNLIRLFRFAEKKINEPIVSADSESESGSKKEAVQKKIRILAFGHENQVLVALNTYFAEQGIHNCEVLSIESGDEGEVIGTFRGKEVSDLSK